MERIKLTKVLDNIPESGEVIVISREGKVFPAIYGLEHPPTTTGRVDLGRTVDWIYQHKLESYVGGDVAFNWLRTEVARTLTQHDSDVADTKEVWTALLIRTTECCKRFWRIASKITKELEHMSIDDLHEIVNQNTQTDSVLVEAINQRFLRVRAGGKYFPEENDYRLYFTVASKDFNWLPVISDYMDSYFPSKNRPDIWIGTDRRGIGREIVYYEGTGNFKHLGRAVMDKNSLEILAERLEEMNHFELVVVYEQYLRYKEQGTTDEQPLRDLLDNQADSDVDLCPDLTVSSAITKEMAERWYKRYC